MPQKRVCGLSNYNSQHVGYLNIKVSSLPVQKSVRTSLQLQLASSANVMPDLRKITQIKRTLFTILELKRTEKDL